MTELQSRYVEDAFKRGCGQDNIALYLLLEVCASHGFPWKNAESYEELHKEIRDRVRRVIYGIKPVGTDR